MKRILTVLSLGICALWMNSCATSTPPAAPTAETKAVPAENVEQTIVKMEREWMDAIVKQDAAALGRILADDWTGIDWEGQVFDKAKSIADLPSLKITSITMDPLKVRVYGDTAVVTGGDVEKSTYKGRNSSGHYLWTDVFVKRNGQWQAVSSHNSKEAAKR